MDEERTCAMSGVPRRVYLQDSVLPFGEDSRHEFKGHRCLSVEELPKRCFIPGTLRRSRKAVSRTLNGFLNTGQGGTVYLGVLDDGTVNGISMSLFQIEHLKVSLSDLMRRYNPPVMKSHYKVCFVPVMKNHNLTTLEKYLAGMNFPMKSILFTDEEENFCRYNCSEIAQLQESVDGEVSFKAHLIRTSKKCWCDKLQLTESVSQPKYIVEITIRPFFIAITDPVALQLHPVYEDEEGRCYLRRSASTAALTHWEVAEMTKIQARNHFVKVIQHLQRELDSYEESVTTVLGSLL